MDGEAGSQEQSLTDIQSYLANFNKEIVGQPGNNQGYQILQQGDLSSLITDGSGGATLTVVQAEDGTTQLVMTAPPTQQEMKQEDGKDEFEQALDGTGEDDEQPLMTPAAPSMTEEDETNGMMEGGHMTTLQPAVLSMDDSGQAVQMLASVAANTIPQADLTDGGKMMGLNTMDMGEEEEEANQDQSLMVNTGNSYQTVTIVPSEVNQGGDVSYVLIVSQPDGEGGMKDEKDINIDMSIYDFKEEKGAIEEPEESQESPKKVIRVTPKRTPTGMQAQLMCNYCNYTSPKRYLLTRHMKTHSEERPHKCNICDRGFKTVASLQNHINTHTGMRPHRCKECEACFTTSGELVRHVRYRHTFERPHHCTDCDYTSVELSKLKRHMRSHTGERPYQCPHCTYASPDTFKLKRHLRIHTGEKPYECNVCHARFTQSNSLKSHQLIHTGNKPVFQCELCPTTCGRKTDLKIHVQKLHTSDRPLQCRKCGKSFPDRYTYKIHLKTHEGEKCYRCELCPYAALSQRHLQSHILTHTGEKPYQCSECDQSFRQKQLLKRHKNLYHTPDYIPPAPREKLHECTECGRTFAHRGNLLRHMALHDPNNPDYQEMLAEEGELEEAEDQHVQYVQIVSDDQHQTSLGNGRGPVQLQLVTEDGQNTILLQMDEDGDAMEVIQQAQQQLTVAKEETPTRKRGRPAKTQQIQLQFEDADGNVKLEGTQVIAQAGEDGEFVILKQEDDKEKHEDAEDAQQDEGEEMEDEEEGDEEEDADEGSPRKRRKVVDSKKNIEECFGFDVEEEES